MTTRRVIIAVTLVALVAPMGGCFGYAPRGRDYEEGGEGPGGRDQPLGMSPKQEYAIGLRAYEEVMQQYGDRLLPADHPQVRRVSRVTSRLARAAEIEPLQREINLRLRGYRFEWEANVVREKQVNAFCLPAGKMFVFTGILAVIGDDDDYLATVMSHEISHALAHHASERIAQRDHGQSVLGSLKFERWQESEADHIGVFLMAFAGFDPEKAVGFWGKMQKASAGERQIEFLSSHPSHAHRAKQLAEWAPKARAAKKAYDEKRIAA